MAQRWFVEEVRKLRLGAGEVFRGDGILPATKVLQESRVNYVAGCQGAPTPHLMDILDGHGIRFGNSASGRGGGAMPSRLRALGATYTRAAGPAPQGDAQALITEGVRRLIDRQDPACAGPCMDRLAPVQALPDWHALA